MLAIDHYLDKLAETYPNSKGKGDVFEKIISELLTLSEKNRFEKVYLWKDWPDRFKYGFNDQDVGVDLVAKLSPEYGGKHCAIQCKFKQTGQVSAKEIDSFLATSANKSIFTDKILVSTADIGRNADIKIKQANPRCAVYDKAHLNQLPIDWRSSANNLIKPLVKLKIKPKTPRSFQRQALKNIRENFLAGKPRGQLIMPCGTGKTLVSLWAVEENVRSTGWVLYLVPSIALMRQTLQVWNENKNKPFDGFSVCSDKTVVRGEEIENSYYVPGKVLTNSEQLSEWMNSRLRGWHSNKHHVIFSTYQSLPLVKQAVANLDGFNQFDLIICDEAHRTTGFEESEDDPGSFRLVHNNDKIPARRRLYMTATPRLFKESTKKNKQPGQLMVDMSDQEIYGLEFYRLSFAEAIDQGLLCDYEVLVIAIEEQSFAIDSLNKLVTEVNDQRKADRRKLTIKLEDVLTLFGCYDALSDVTTEKVTPFRQAGQLNDDFSHLKSAICFTTRIEKSKLISNYTPRLFNNNPQRDLWKRVVDQYLVGKKDVNKFLRIEPEHVDGTMSASVRSDKIKQVKQTKTGVCRILSNVKALTEGVDIPALDAVIFLDPKQSEIDIVQAIGRVMRRDPGNPNKIGYVIIPVFIESGKEIQETANLTGVNAPFKIVWNVVRALRSHDERVDFWIHAGNKPIKALRSTGTKKKNDLNKPQQARLIPFTDLGDKVASTLVKRCGDRQLWQRWGRNTKNIYQTILVKVQDDINQNRGKFDYFHKNLKSVLTEDVLIDDVAKMISQQIIVGPIFAKLFEGFSVENNPISKLLMGAIDSLEIEYESDLIPLERTYSSMKSTISNSATAEDRVELLRSIYDSFFAEAMPGVVRQLGAVYTPTKIVDKMILLTDELCRQNFGKGIGDKNTEILEPFAGTGTFLYRILTLKNDLGEYVVPSENFVEKFENEIHANEVVLLAYYIAVLKITSGAVERGFDKYVDFAGFSNMVLGNTFLSSRQSTLIRDSNQKKFANQANRSIQIIISNPPWLAGKKQADAEDYHPVSNDFGGIEEVIQKTYGKKHSSLSKGTGAKALGNSYIKAVRWASDRLISSQAGGIVAFVHPNSLLNANSLAGVRAQLRDEFSGIYTINLRGNAYTSGDEFKREGDKIFGSGSRNGVAVTFLVRNPDKTLPGRVNYVEVAPYQTKEQKLEWLGQIKLSDFEVIPIKNNPRHDWVDLTDGSFQNLIPLVDKKEKEKTIVKKSIAGIATNMDNFVYDFNPSNLERKIKAMLLEYNLALDIYRETNNLDESIGNTNKSKIKWTDKLKNSLKKQIELEYNSSLITPILYRPFVKKYLYADSRILTSCSVLKEFSDNLNLEQAFNVKTPSNSSQYSSTPTVTNVPVDMGGIGMGGGQTVVRQS